MTTTTAPSSARPEHETSIVQPKPIVVKLAPQPSAPPTLLSIFGGAALGALVVLFVKPFVDWLYARVGQNRAYSYHMADRIRDFRESVAVVNSIEFLGRQDRYPVDTHIAKLGIPDSLVTDKAVDVKSLSHDTAADALRMSNVLVNINRDCASILASKKAGDSEAFYKQLFELGDKMRNLSSSWEKELTKFRLRRLRLRPVKVKPLSDRPKQIMYDDGRKGDGVVFCVTWPPAIESLWPLPMSEARPPF